MNQLSISPKELKLMTPMPQFERGAGVGGKPTTLPPVVGAGRHRKLPPVQVGGSVGLKKPPGAIGFQPLSTLVPPGVPSSTLIPASTPDDPAAQSEHFIKHQDTDELKDFLKHY